MVAADMILWAGTSFEIKRHDCSRTAMCKRSRCSSWVSLEVPSCLVPVAIAPLEMVYCMNSGNVHDSWRPVPSVP